MAGACQAERMRRRGRKFELRVSEGPFTTLDIEVIRKWLEFAEFTLAEEPSPQHDDADAALQREG